MATIGVPFTSSRIMSTELFFCGIDGIAYRSRLGLRLWSVGPVVHAVMSSLQSSSTRLAHMVLVGEADWAKWLVPCLIP